MGTKSSLWRIPEIHFSELKRFYPNTGDLKERFDYTFLIVYSLVVHTPFLFCIYLQNTVLVWIIDISQ